MYQIIVLGLNLNGVILLSDGAEYGRNKKENNGKPLLLMHALCDNNKDSSVKGTPSKLKTFVLTQSKTFATSRYILTKILKPCLYILEKDVHV